jgi:hypothetical protein
MPRLALGLAAFFAFAIVSFPASLAHRWFAPDELALASLHGTIWRGSAAQGAVSGIPFSDLSWRLNPVSLLTGKVDLIIDELRISGGSVRAQVTASRSATSIRVVDVFMNLQPLTQALPQLGDIRGQVSARELQVELADGWPVSAEGEVRVAGLAVPPLIPVNGIDRVLLGNFRAVLNAAEAPVIATQIVDEGGPIELVGTLRLMPDRTYELDARIRARAEASDILVQGIDLVSGPPDAEGRRDFRQSGAL